ncbi:DNA translocase FtsK [Pseudomonas sp. RIT-PI-S]|uniref:DNA translocase FtsK n=1 Tax=Pseudomonas sp. RIT-PI-S TaxID=3035295 RepID=UPI0021D91B1E|nr:DNA translocase FtsK [Pseudomonas sp. RIT-PI-S]
MKKSTAKPVPVPLWRQQFHYRLKEGALIAVAALCLYLWMALLSYDQGDPGWSHTGTSVGQVQNAAGRAGAYAADILFMVLGYFAYVFPLLLGVKAWQIFRERHQAWQWSGWLFSWRLIGLVFLVLSGAALAHLHFHSAASLPASAGGALGESLGDLARNALNVQGSTLLFIALFLFGLTVFTDLSWFSVMDTTGKITLDLFELVTGMASRWWAARSEQRRLVASLRGEEAVYAAEAPPARREPRAEPRMEAKPQPPVAVRQEPVFEPRAEAPAAPASAPVVAMAAAGAPARARVPEVALRMPWDDEDELESFTADGRAPVLDAPRLVAERVAQVSAPVLPPIIAPSAQPPAVPPPAAKVEPVRRMFPEKPEPPMVDAALEGTIPPLSILDPVQKKQVQYSPESLAGVGQLLEIKLKEFGVEVTVDSIHPGPVITRYEIQPAAGVKVSRISNLAKDLARSLAVTSVRVVEVIPGKTTVGIEIPNEDRQIVRFSEVLSTPQYDDAQSPVTLALGHDIGGKPVITDLAKMPHLLVAGTTGSGKSVGVNAMILSILFKSTPQDARLIMIDPKMLELSIYEGIPHLLCPVVTDMKDAANALRWSVAEMERRYKLMAAMGVRNLGGFNRKVKDAEEAGTPLGDPLYRRESMEDEAPLLKTLPTIVVVVDEFADMMMIVGKKVEELIARIAQKARAAGIHLILATQRPSVDVITGLIKANIPTRMAFQVSSKIDSRTIIDQGGAEQLLGHGDMLYMPPGTSLPIRVHGAFVSDDEVHRVVEAWKMRGTPDYNDDILNGIEEGGGGSFEGAGGGDGDDSESDALYDEAVAFVLESRRASISSVQRKLKIGYNRAARMIEAMEMAGVVTPMNSNGSRDVIAPGPLRD